MIVAGLDLGPNLTGWAVGDGLTVPACDVWEFDRVGENYGGILLQLEDYLDVMFTRWPSLGAVTVETPLLIASGGKKRYGDKLSTLRMIYPMSSFVSWYCQRRDVAYSEVSVYDVKREATGKATAEKADIALIAEACGVKLPSGPGRLDASDAWAVWKCGLRKHDRPTSERWDAMIYSKGRGGLI